MLLSGQQLDVVCNILFVYVWLLDGRTFWLVLKTWVQLFVVRVQHAAQEQWDPAWALYTLLCLPTVWTCVVTISHLAGPSVVTSGKEHSVLLDFVGQQYSPSRLHLVLLDSLVGGIQLALAVIVFQVGKDQTRPDEEASDLDVAPRDHTDHYDGQGWDTRDEEASLFTPSSEQRSATNSLVHPIAVLRPLEIWNQRPSLPNYDDIASPSQPPPTTSPPQHTQRPDTSRIRRFSRHHRTLPSQTQAQTTPPDASVDDSWPPMWLVIARNMVGSSRASSPTSLLRRPTRAFASLRTAISSRIPSTTASARPEPPDS